MQRDEEISFLICGTVPRMMEDARRQGVGCLVFAKRCDFNKWKSGQLHMGLNPKPSKIGNCLLDSNNLEVPQLWETPMSNTVGQCYILGIHTLGHLERERVSERGRDCTIFTKRT